MREEDGHELLDAGASDAFAVADHQVAHVYIADPGRAAEVAAHCRDLPGVEQVLDAKGRAEAGLDHERAGSLVLVAAPRRWFTYDYWVDDRHAPDFARTVDIHRKPGYDPRELFLDPRLPFPRLRIGWTLMQRRLGGRALLRVIPLDTALVRGSHGRVEGPETPSPLMITRRPPPSGVEQLPCTGVRDVILDHLFGD